MLKIEFKIEACNWTSGLLENALEHTLGTGSSSALSLASLQSRRKGFDPSCDRSLIREIKFPDTPLLIPCSDLCLWPCFSRRMCGLENKSAISEAKILQIPCCFPC